ncbi:receptor like protein kinase S.2-like [Triticum dicoccoides]|uniref:receptor like protein kinase S.2-like n=1 Tax=Triticum dicoccoides TaxID=85692 RepID=UPI000E78BBD6|nr:receptor like protein kinase S.2-like [Triticum dicoccoides]
MDSEISIRHKDDLDRMLLDGSAEPTYMTLSLLEDITNCFSDDHEIGRGGFAVVYKGIVGKGMVAVKKLFETFDEHGYNKFHKEVECMMKAKHKNIVRFLGYCSDAQGRIVNYEGKFVMADLRNLLLCFEYVPNGSLDKYITDASSGLEWRERYKIIKGICEGLLHLHGLRILHLDLKPANILVDDCMVPKIADFGISRCLDKEQTRDSTLHPCGSLGYLAPESFEGKLAFASDVYSLGVIIVEILTGKKGYPEEEDVIETWMNRLKGSDQWERQLEQVRVCTKIGIECMDSDPKKRPVARYINDRLDKTTSTIETGISSCQGHVADLSSEYLGKEITKHSETEELAEHLGTLRENQLEQGQDEAPSDEWSLWEVHDTKQNVSQQGAGISNSSVLHKLNNLDIINQAARINYVRYGGPMLEKINFLKVFKKEELEPTLKVKNRQDGFGEVYIGRINEVPVIVRKLISGSVVQNEKFAEEVIIQSQVLHKNIVRLIGCCVEVDTPMIVYEYLAKGCLHDILHNNKKVDLSSGSFNNVELSLGVRLNIAAESAYGLAYMYSGRSIKTLHGNVKSENILLDEHFMPKISDFGLSRLSTRAYKHIEIFNGGIGYIDVVYLHTGVLTEQNDVYSFGVLMLELLTRKKGDRVDSNSFVKSFLENHETGRKSTELFDKEIAVAGDLELLENLAKIAADCLNNDFLIFLYRGSIPQAPEAEQSLAMKVSCKGAHAYSLNQNKSSVCLIDAAADGVCVSGTHLALAGVAPHRVVCIRWVAFDVLLPSL